MVRVASSPHVFLGQSSAMRRSSPVLTLGSHVCFPPYYPGGGKSVQLQLHPSAWNARPPSLACLPKLVLGLRPPPPMLFCSDLQGVAFIALEMAKQSTLGGQNSNKTRAGHVCIHHCGRFQKPQRSNSQLKQPRICILSLPWLLSYLL